MLLYDTESAEVRCSSSGSYSNLSWRDRTHVALSVSFHTVCCVVNSICIHFFLLYPGHTGCRPDWFCLCLRQPRQVRRTWSRWKIPCVFKPQWEWYNSVCLCVPFPDPTHLWSSRPTAWSTVTQTHPRRCTTGSVCCRSPKATQGMTDRSS